MPEDGEASEEQLPALTSPLSERLRRSPSAASREYWQRLHETALAEPEPFRSRHLRNLHSSREEEFYASAFELFWVNYFVQRGLTFEREPIVEGTSRRPDFRVEHPVQPFFLEATVLMDSRTDQSQQWLLRDLEETLASVRGNYRAIAIPLNQVPGSYSRRRVRTWFARTVGNLPASISGEGIRMTYQDRADGIEFAIDFIFSSSDASDAVMSASMPHGPAAVEVNTWQTMRDKVDGKIAQYGNGGAFPLPYTVAIHLNTSFPPTGFQVTRALYGDPEVHLLIHQGDHHATPIVTYSPNGILTSHDRDGAPLRTRISAVALYHHYILVSDEEHEELAVFHHPFPRNRLSTAVLSELPQVELLERNGGGLQPRWTGTPPSWVVSRWESG